MNESNIVCENLWSACRASELGALRWDLLLLGTNVPLWMSVEIRTKIAEQVLRACTLLSDVPIDASKPSQGRAKPGAAHPFAAK